MIIIVLFFLFYTHIYICRNQITVVLLKYRTLDYYYCSIKTTDFSYKKVQNKSLLLPPTPFLGSTVHPTPIKFAFTIAQTFDPYTPTHPNSWGLSKLFLCTNKKKKTKIIICIKQFLSFSINSKHQ